MTDERNVYVDKVRDDMVDDDEISPEEEGFMKGYNEADDKADDEAHDEGKDD